MMCSYAKFLDQVGTLMFNNLIQYIGYLASNPEKARATQ